jgi:Fe2+ or Zn2+ uptake regulation protein
MAQHAPVDLRASLVAGGHRVTGPRRAVWGVIESAADHLTADEIADKVRLVDPDVNLSSVYRSLSLFSELGLVRVSSLDGGGAVHWEIAHPDDQFHLRCRSCGKVEHHVGDLVDQIRSHLAGDHDYLVEQVDLVVTGLCTDCQGVGA